MVEPVSTAALVGLGWFANKVFGPSADAIGGGLKAHLESRVPAIFNRAETLAKEGNIQIGPIKPGLLTKMIIDASFSEENDGITQWWANLFVSAGSRQVETNVQAVFSDIMAMIGPNEANVLEEFVAYYRQQVEHLPASERAAARKLGPLVQDRLLNRVIEKFPLTGDNINFVHQHFENPNIPVPIRTYAWAIPEDKGNGLVWGMTTKKWYSDNRLSIEILERSRIFKFVRVSIPLMANQPAWVDLVALTDIGIEFYQACSGSALEGEITQ
ncbi:Abi-alpha family protein [Parasphingorhabdus sp.]|uniref:Abi-alpha family protein n=1 Tax=Parasphingorhabdus sp. TaxID=2709688 RepID=UPI003A8F7AD2